MRFFIFSFVFLCCFALSEQGWWWGRRNKTPKKEETKKPTPRAHPTIVPRKTEPVTQPAVPTVPESVDDGITFDISMPAYEPRKNNAYVCFKKKVTVSGYITEIIPHSSMDRVHHMILYGCETRRTYNERVGDCLDERYICPGAKRTRLIFAWARNADPLKFPEGIGVPLGKVPHGYTYLAMQAHYFSPFDGNTFDYSGFKIKVSPMLPERFAGIYRLVTYRSSVPANTIGSNITMSCQPSFRFKNVPTTRSLKVFAYRIHTHDYGTLVSAYVRNKGSSDWRLIGKTHPQFPQNFWPVGHDVSINPNDVIQGVCRYNSSGSTRRIPTGLKSTQEMCNFYVYYSYPSNTYNPLDGTRGCFKAGSPRLRDYPSEGFSYVQPNIALWKKGNRTTDMFGVMDIPTFPFTQTSFGDIAGLTFDKENQQLIVFHRTTRKYSNFITAKTGTIKQATITMLNPRTGQELDAFGANMFYLPHGISTDHQGYIWVTDVASQQVHKLDPATKQIVKTLGKAFPNSRDDPKTRFYKPTNVAVASDGSVYISDGYQNRRVVKYGPSGLYEKEYNFGGNRRAGVMHDIHLDEENQKLFVADREKGDVQIINLATEKVEKPLEIGGKVQGIHHCSRGNILYVLTDSRVRGRDSKEALKVIAFHMATKEKLFAFDGTHTRLRNPHAITSNEDCEVVYVGEIAQTAGRLITFQIEHKFKKPPVEPDPLFEGEEPEVDREVPM